jgi:hypothetical protein
VILLDQHNKTTEIANADNVGHVSCSHESIHFSQKYSLKSSSMIIISKWSLILPNANKRTDELIYFQEIK